MIAAGESQTFGVYETASCKHCGEDIERRRLIGWLKHCSNGGVHHRGPGTSRPALPNLQ